VDKRGASSLPTVPPPLPLSFPVGEAEGRVEYKMPMEEEKKKGSSFSLFFPFFPFFPFTSLGEEVNSMKWDSRREEEVIGVQSSRSPLPLLLFFFLSPPFL